MIEVTWTKKIPTKPGYYLAISKSIFKDAGFDMFGVEVLMSKNGPRLQAMDGETLDAEDYHYFSTEEVEVPKELG